MRLYAEADRLHMPVLIHPASAYSSASKLEFAQPYLFDEVARTLAAAAAESRFQFERQGYFTVDPVDSAPGAPVFNRIVTLRDSWAKK